MAEAKGIKIGDEVRTFKDETARDAASAANDKAEQALTDASEALQETVALEADLPERVKQIVAAMLPQETLLWTNPNPTQPVTIMQIPIANLLSYDEIRVTAINTLGEENDTNEARIKIQNTKMYFGFIHYIGPADGYDTLYISRRNFGINIPNGRIDFFQATRVNFENGQPITLETNTDRQIPMRIYGIKYPK